jgi:hypothetical protein
MSMLHSWTRKSVLVEYPADFHGASPRAGFLCSTVPGRGRASAISVSWASNMSNSRSSYQSLSHPNQVVFQNRTDHTSMQIRKQLAVFVNTSSVRCTKEGDIHTYMVHTLVKAHLSPASSAAERLPAATKGSTRNHEVNVETPIPWIG